LKNDGEQTAIKNERYIMHLIFSPLLANIYYVGGGGGLLLVIVVVVLLARR
jgi:cellobiose-specific phosphotransferase system component IIC